MGARGRGVWCVWWCVVCVVHGALIYNQCTREMYQRTRAPFSLLFSRMVQSGRDMYHVDATQLMLYRFSLLKLCKPFRGSMVYNLHVRTRIRAFPYRSNTYCVNM